jgi:hypothetical protein
MRFSDLGIYPKEMDFRDSSLPEMDSSCSFYIQTVDWESSDGNVDGHCRAVIFIFGAR